MPPPPLQAITGYINTFLGGEGVCHPLQPIFPVLRGPPPPVFKGAAFTQTRKKLQHLSFRQPASDLWGGSDASVQYKTSAEGSISSSWPKPAPAPPPHICGRMKVGAGLSWTCGGEWGGTRQKISPVFLLQGLSSFSFAFFLLAAFFSVSWSAPKVLL